MYFSSTNMNLCPRVHLSLTVSLTYSVKFALCVRRRRLDLRNTGETIHERLSFFSLSDSDFGQSRIGQVLPPNDFSIQSHTAVYVKKGPPQKSWWSRKR